MIDSTCLNYNCNVLRCNLRSKIGYSMLDVLPDTVKISVNGYGAADAMLKKNDKKHTHFHLGDIHAFDHLSG